MARRSEEAGRSKHSYAITANTYTCRRVQQTNQNSRSTVHRARAAAHAVCVRNRSVAMNRRRGVVGESHGARGDRTAHGAATIVPNQSAGVARGVSV